VNNTVQLDLGLALKARNEGLAQVEDHNQIFLETARGIARMLCHLRGEITNDDVRVECERRGIYPKHKNCWGGIFHSREFEAVGLTRSKQVQGHGNLVRVYVLRGAV
jgi:hypothetical protein